jgi:hypothetical protein
VNEGDGMGPRSLELEQGEAPWSQRPLEQGAAPRGDGACAWCEVS